MGEHTDIQPLSKFILLICTITPSMNVIIWLSELFILDHWHDTLETKPDLDLEEMQL